MISLRQRVAATLSPSAKARLAPLVERVDARIAAVRWRVDVVLGRLSRWVAPRKWPSNESRVLVNLGCGPIDHPSFVNVDGYPYPHVHFVHRIDRLPMFEAGSVDMIYASHCLEHFRYRDLDAVLKEWARVLRPGGVLRLSVPDLERLLAIHGDTGDADDIVEQLMGGQDNPFNFHHAVFDRTNLTKHLVGAGFVRAREWVPGSDGLTPPGDFSVYQKTVRGKTYPISLNLEATKV